MYEYWSSVKVNVHEMEKLLGAAEPQKFLPAKVSAFKVTNSYCTNQLFSWYYYQLLVSLVLLQTLVSLSSHRASL